MKDLSAYSPKRIILDRNLSIKKNSYTFFKVQIDRNTIIFYNKGTQPKFNQLKKRDKINKTTILNNNNFFDLKFSTYKKSIH